MPDQTETSERMQEFERATAGLQDMLDPPKPNPLPGPIHVERLLMPPAMLCPVCHGPGAVPEKLYRGFKEAQFDPNYDGVMKVADGFRVCRACHGTGVIRAANIEVEVTR